MTQMITKTKMKIKNKDLIYFYNKIKDDVEIKDLEFEEDDILRLYNYVNERNECNKLNKGYYPKIDKNTLEIKYYIKPTSKTVVGLEGVFSKADLSDFHLTSPERKIMYNKALNFINKILSGKETKGLYLHGGFGVGKSYLAAAILKELSKSNIDSVFIYLPDLSRHLTDDFKSLEEKINKYKNTKVLVIDDIGAEKNSEWLRDDILGPIINYRKVNKYPIIFTSNFDLKEFKNHLCFDNDENRTTRILYRIIDNVEVVNCGSLINKN